MIPPKAYLESLPPDTPVPVRAADLLALQTGDTVSVVGAPSADLTAQEVGAFLHRSSSTIRGWLESGVLHGYKLRQREWRVPRAELERFQRDESTRKPEAPRLGRSSRKPVSLSAWRAVS